MEVLEATLFWGDTDVKRVSVPFWDKVRIGDLFAVPDELATRVIDFGPKPFVGERKMVTWGSLGVVVEVALAEDAPPPARPDGALTVGLLFAAAFHLLLFAGGRAFVEGAGDEPITADRIDAMRGYLDDDAAAPRLPDRPLDQRFSDDEGRRSRGAPGPRTGERGPQAGAAHAGSHPLSRSEALDGASSFGVVELVDGIGVGTSTWGRADPNGPALAWNEGGGLALSGTGEGGGGVGHGVDLDPSLGLGSTGAGPGGGCDATCQGVGLGTGRAFGHGGGHGQGGHVAKAPRICGEGTACAASVTGRLPPEAIQRIVRSNFGRFRLCYENALVGNPSIHGRIAVDFLIGRDGSVAMAKEGEGSEFANAEARACVVRAFSSLQFPEPTDGVVRVSYPLTFDPE